MMRTTIDKMLIALVALSGAGVGCGGNVGEAVRPEDPTAKDALGLELPECDGAPTYAEPLVVDWDTNSRADLEVAMKEGLVVVSYDCKSIKLLKGCKLDGDYEFAGVSRKEQIVQMKSSDELAANLPLSAVKLSSEVKAGKSIDLAMVLVGKRSAPLYEATAEDLVGACDGATHFVRAANLGAFAMATGTVGKASAAVEIWQAGANSKSESEKSTTNKDGSLDSCKTSKPDAPEPPSECQSAVRLELMPLSDQRKDKKEKAAAKEARKITQALDPCPKGFVLSGGICTNDANAPRLCKVDDEAGCKAQCDRKHAESCQNLGAILAKKKDIKGSNAAYEKACVAEIGDACATLGWNLFAEADEPSAKIKDQAMSYLGKACSLGSGIGCENAGYVAESGFEDVLQAASYYSRACKLGSGYACSSLSIYYFEGREGIKKDPTQGLKLLARACNARNDEECDTLARVLFKGDYGVTKNPKLAAKIEQIACNMDAYAFCLDAGRYWKAVGDASKAVAAWERGCNSPRTDVEACRMLALAHREGEGTAKDEAKANKLLQKACQNGEGDEGACKLLGIAMK